ncbi:MAG TPA: IPT/TIG domain-containing protein, partial [Bryobacteraceae bacterium]
MGSHSLKHYSTVLLFLAVSSQAAFGASQLRLSTAAVGPISIAQGTNGSTQTIGAYNAGDGSLNLTITTNASWLSAQTGDPIPCPNDYGKTCTAINISLNTADLSNGTLTGFLHVTDPNSLDAPQDVTVTVQVGGGVPDQMTFYVPPDGSTTSQAIKTSNSFIASSGGQPGGGVTLTLVQNGGGSYATTFGYNVLVSAAAGTVEGPYAGALNVFGSVIDNDNKQVPVNIQVTSQPIASAYPASLFFKIANTGTPQTTDINFYGPGTDSLGVTGADPGGASWLTFQMNNGNTVTAVVDPTGLPNGIYTTTITIASNAANPVTVPVTFEVVDPDPPVSKFQTVVSLAGSAPSSNAVALGDLVTIQGQLFTVQSTQSADPTQQLPTSLGGATVSVNGVPAPIFSVSSSQIQFQIPYEVSPGDSTVEVDRDGLTGNVVSVEIQPAAPKVTQI